MKYKKIINQGFLIDNYIFYLSRSFNNKLPFEVGGQVHFDRNYFGLGGSLLKQKKYNNLDYKIIKSMLSERQYNNFLKEIAKNKINKKIELDHNVEQKELADKITSYLGGRRKTKKAFKNKQKKTRRSKK